MIIVTIWGPQFNGFYATLNSQETKFHGIKTQWSKVKNGLAIFFFVIDGSISETMCFILYILFPFLIFCIDVKKPIHFFAFFNFWLYSSLPICWCWNLAWAHFEDELYSQTQAQIGPCTWPASYSSQCSWLLLNSKSNSIHGDLC